MAVQEAINKDLTVVYDEALHARFLLWRDHADRSVSRVATLLGRATASVSQYTNKKFVGDLAEMEKDISNLLRREEDLQFVGDDVAFCPTSPSTLIWEVLQFCDQKQKMGAAMAPSGTGKTETCREYKKQNRATIFITADISTRRIGAVLNLLARQVSGGRQGRSISDMLHGFIDRLKGSRRLIIVDDAHFLTWEAYEALRKLHDCAGVGVVYVGQELLYEQMKGASSKSYLFDQIFSRIAIKRDTFQVKKTDARKIAQSLCKGPNQECIEYLFLKIRAVSVGNEVDLVFTDAEDEDKKHEFKINLDDVIVKFPNGAGELVMAGKTPIGDTFNIKMGDESGIVMKYPPSTVYESKPFTTEDATPEDLLEQMVVASLEKYYDGDKVVKFRDCPPDEVKEFINNLDVKT